jgi:predicted nucleic acid-binding protein
VAYRAAAEPAYGFVLAWATGGRRISITATTALEVVARSTDEDDRQRRRHFAEHAVVVPATADAYRAAERLLWAVPLPTRLTADDALVAVTALRLKLPLDSLDPARYSGVPGLTVLPAS